MARTLHRSKGVTAMRKLAVFAVAFGIVVVALSPRRRARIAQKLEESRRFISRRRVDRDARDRSEPDRWADDGGNLGAFDATNR